MAKKGNIPWNKGLTKEIDNRIKSRKFTEEHKRKISESKKGHIVLEQTRSKLSKYFKENPTRSFTGHKHTNKSNASNREKHLGKIPWNKGTGYKTSLSKKIEALKKYNKWRLQVFSRDKFTCVNCKNIGGELRAHHIKQKALIIKENNIFTIQDAENCKELWDINNGVTLCEKCHKLTENFAKRI